MAEAFIGEIRMFGGNFAPMGWALCDGRLLPIAQYDALFSLIGNTYGGDGINNFALPDLRGRIPVHQGAGLQHGQSLGQENVTVTVDQMPPHSHMPRAYDQPGSANEPGSGFWAGPPTSRYSSAEPSSAMRSHAITSTGNHQAHDNMMPFQAVTFIICLEGFYPTRD